MNLSPQTQRELVEALVMFSAYAQAALDQFKSGRGTLDISGFHSLLPRATGALAKARKEMEGNNG